MRIGTIVKLNKKNVGLVVFVGGPIPVLPRFENAGWLKRDDGIVFSHGSSVEPHKYPKSLNKKAIVLARSLFTTKYFYMDEAEVVKSTREFRVALPSNKMEAAIKSSVAKVTAGTDATTLKLTELSENFYSVTGSAAGLHALATDLVRIGLGNAMRFQE